MDSLPDGFKAYDIDLYITEIYDQHEIQRDDIAILREQIGGRNALKILELFTGNGRILIPLAEDGHKITGIDKSPTMLESARRKIKQLPKNIQKNITLKQADILKEEWPAGFNLVILGGNCLYELATPEEQENCIFKASKSVKPGGYLYLDNNHMEGDLDLGWRYKGTRKAFPTGVCADGTKVESTAGIIWYDIKNRIVRERRTTEITTPDGKTQKKQWVEQCHAPSTGEIENWLNKHGFSIEKHWGNRDKSPYTDKSVRSIFWAKQSVRKIP